MELYLTDNEVKAIRAWADKNIHGGHWGDSDVAIPEEEIILKKLDKMKDSKVELKENEMKIILIWSESSMGIYNIEEDRVIKKLKQHINNNMQ
ncbi:MAG: hypothetical protein JSV25_08175 [Spirochaetota bacterium]|nr:MAG: hypothetical protein JSV25_08175 [Spirochaetota bacterium]